MRLIIVFILCTIIGCSNATKRVENTSIVPLMDISEKATINRHSIMSLLYGAIFCGFIHLQALAHLPTIIVNPTDCLNIHLCD